MKDKKIGLSGMEWFLSIMGIILLVSVIVLPPVFRTFFPKEEKVDESLDPTIVLSEVSCTKENIGQGYKDQETLLFKTYQNQVRIFNSKIDRVYDDLIVYQEAKTEFGRKVTALSVIGGFSYRINPEDDYLKLSIIEEYDLSVFIATVVTIPGDSDVTNIESKYQFNQDFMLVRQNLETNGYVCQ